jgi:hypothetical protein
VSPVRYECRFYNPENGILHSHRSENLKSYSLANLLAYKTQTSIEDRDSGFKLQITSFRNTGVNAMSMELILIGMTSHKLCRLRCRVSGGFVS